MSINAQHKVHAMKTLHAYKVARVSAACMAVVAGLSACTTTSQPTVNEKVETHIGNVQTRVSRMTERTPVLADQVGPQARGSVTSAEAAAQQQREMPVVRRATKPWLGASMVPVTSDDRLPSVFGEDFVLDFSDLGMGGGVSLQVVAARIAKLSGVPVRISADVYAVSRGNAASGSQGPGSASAGAPLGGLATRVTPPVPGMPVPMNAVPQAQSFRPGAGAASPAVPQAVRMGASGQLAAPTRAFETSPEALSQAEPFTLNNVEMRWNGSLAGYLNMLTDSLGLAWEYRDGTVVISRFVLELHEIAAFQGGSKYSMSTSGSGAGAAGGGGGASNAASASMEVSESGESDPMGSIEKTIKEMLADVPGSSVIRTDGSGRLMVKAPREIQSRVRDYIRSENAALRRQVTIQFDLYSILLDDNDQRGINWGVVLQKAGEAVRLQLNTPAALSSVQAGLAAINVLPNVQGNQISELLGNSAMFLQMLNQQGYSAQHRPISMLALNRQWGRISRNSTEYFLSETTAGPASATGVGAPGLKTDKVTTGDQILALPQILEDNTVMLRFGISLSDLLGLFDVSVGQGNSQQKIQAPKVSAINAQFPVAVRPGEIVAVTGLSRTVASNDNQRLVEGAPLATGGTRKSQFKREHFIVFVRPTLM